MGTRFETPDAGARRTPFVLAVAATLLCASVVTAQPASPTGPDDQLPLNCARAPDAAPTLCAAFSNNEDTPARFSVTGQREGDCTNPSALMCCGAHRTCVVGTGTPWHRVGVSVEGRLLDTPMARRDGAWRAILMTETLGGGRVVTVADVRDRVQVLHDTTPTRAAIVSMDTGATWDAQLGAAGIAVSAAVGLRPIIPSPWLVLRARFASAALPGEVLYRAGISGGVDVAELLRRDGPGSGSGWTAILEASVGGALIARGEPLSAGPSAGVWVNVLAPLVTSPRVSFVLRLGAEGVLLNRVPRGLLDGAIGVASQW